MDERVDEALAELLRRAEEGEPLVPALLEERYPRFHGALREALALEALLRRSRPPRERVGPYRIRRELGRGGMGTVYLADTGASGPVALKVIHPHLLANAGVRARFLREADLGRRIRHPNLAATLEAGVLVEDDREVPYLVMEYVEGQTLEQLLAEAGPLAEGFCRHVGTEVARALAAIHRAGAVHRDVKPSNVLVTRDDAVKLMDLGVARVAEEARRLSHTGAFVGSLLYAAPEQLRGGAAVDERADLYSLGLTVLELATGRRHLPGASPAGFVAPELSPFLEEVLRTLLAEDPRERFASAEELLAVLEAGEESAWWAARRDRASARLRVRCETALHGRGEERARLLELCREARRGEGRVVLLLGEAGIGKTRLLAELERELRARGNGLHLLVGSHPPGAAPESAIVAAFREHLAGADPEEALARYLARAPYLAPPLSALLRGASTSPGSSPKRETVQAAFAELARALAAEHPTVVVVEDLHFAPEEGRALFAGLAAAARGHRIVLVGTSRFGLPERWLSEIQEVAETIVLKRLAPEDLRDLVAEALRPGAPDPEIVSRVARKSEGNPFFALALVQALRRDSRLLLAPDGFWTLTPSAGEMEVPEAVRDLIRANLAKLRAGDRELLEAAACSGFEFDPALVAEALGRRVLAALRGFARLEKLHRLVRSSGRRLAFDHHMIQEVTHEGLPGPMRAHYHAALGAAMERCHPAGERRGAVAVDLCRHLLAGGRGTDALAHLEPALDHLRASYQHERGAEVARQALAAPGLLAGARRLRTLLHAAGHLEFLGRRPELLQVLEEARAVTDRDGSAADRARVGWMLGWNLYLLGRLDEAARVAEEGAAAAREARLPGEEARAITILGYACERRGDPANALRHHERTLALAREAGDPDLKSGSAVNLGTVLLETGNREAARALYEEALKLSHAAVDPGRGAVAAGHLGLLLSDAGHFEEARRHYARAIDIASRIGHRRIEVTVSGKMAELLLRLGRLGECKALGVRLAEIGDVIGDAEVLAARGRLYARLGDGPRARALFGEALEAAQGTVARVEAEAIHGLGLLDLEEGRAGDGERRLEEALARYRGQESAADIARVEVDLARVRLERGAAGEAEPMLERARARARELDQPGMAVLALCLAARFLGGDAGDARRALREHEARLDHRDRMEAHLLLFEATGDADDRAAARRLLDELVALAPPEDRDAMVERVSLHRRVRDA